ncbi:MAG: TIGR03943 family protein [Anaerolineae bacterium]
MKIRQSLAERLKALIMILLAIFLMQRLVSGSLFYYINQRYMWLAIVAIVLLIILAGSYNLVKSGADEDEGEMYLTLSGFAEQRARSQTRITTLLLVALPFILGAIVPAQPLGSAAIDNRGISTSLAARSNSNTTLASVPGERNILDWVRAMNTNPDPASLEGQEADLVGFVYRDIRFEDDQFMVARFTLTCCVADATAIGVVVNTPMAADFPTDSWVQVTGTFAAGTLDGQEMPVLIAEEIVPIEQPEQPYLFQ